MLPPLALVYLPVLQSQIAQHWQDAPAYYLAAQVDKETCYSPTHWKCWNPRAELKTAREYGFGLGQLTVTKAFNNFKAARGWDKSLADWQWENRFDAGRQLAALVIYDRDLYRALPFASSQTERLAFTFSAYNGGKGGVIKDRALCRNTPGCDQNKWFGHVEKQSFRVRTAVKGYGQSFFDTNRGYVREIMTVRYKKYQEALQSRRVPS